MMLCLEKLNVVCPMAPRVASLFLSSLSFVWFGLLKFGGPAAKGGNKPGAPGCPNIWQVAKLRALGFFPTGTPGMAGMEAPGMGVCFPGGACCHTLRAGGPELCTGEALGALLGIGPC